MELLLLYFLNYIFSLRTLILKGKCTRSHPKISVPKSLELAGRINFQLSRMESQTFSSQYFFNFLKTTVDSNMGFCLYGLGLLILTLLQIKIETLSKTSAHVPLAIRVMASLYACGPWRTALHRQERERAVRHSRPQCSGESDWASGPPSRVQQSPGAPRSL